MLRIAAQQGRLAPIEPTCQNQSVEAVVLSIASCYGQETLLKARTDGVNIDGLAALMHQVEVLHPERLPGGQNRFVWTL